MSNNVNETGFTFSDYMNFSGGAQNIMRQGGGGFQSSGLPSAGDINQTHGRQAHAHKLNGRTFP